MTYRNLAVIIKKYIIVLSSIIIIIVPQLLIRYNKNIQKKEVTSESYSKEQLSDIIVYTPQPNDVVTNPLVVRGKARGTWYFEGEFPITLYYGVKDAFVNINAFALGEWMTEDYVDFEVIINFPVPSENDGLLVLSKNNPSDLRENDASLRIPLRFHNN